MSTHNICFCGEIKQKMWKPSPIWSYDTAPFPLSRLTNGWLAIFFFFIWRDYEGENVLFLLE